jgi:hypothetical protein
MMYEKIVHLLTHIVYCYLTCMILINPVGVGTIGLEITPSYVTAQVGSLVVFTCKYKGMEKLNVTFRDNGIPVSWEVSESGSPTWTFLVSDCYEHRIQCVIETPDGTILGSVTSLVNPGSK